MRKRMRKTGNLKTLETVFLIYKSTEVEEQGLYTTKDPAKKKFRTNVLKSVRKLLKNRSDSCARSLYNYLFSGSSCLLFLNIQKQNDRFFTQTQTKTSQKKHSLAAFPL